MINNQLHLKKIFIFLNPPIELTHTYHEEIYAYEGASGTRNNVQDDDCLRQRAG